MLALEDFEKREKRYGALPLAARARLVLTDAEPALAMADDILEYLLALTETAPVIDKIRKNPSITGKMRPSEAKNTLLDSSADFLAAARNKLLSWKKTMERLAGGEGLVQFKGKEYISGAEPVAVAVAGIGAAGAYLSIVQLILLELSKTSDKPAEYQSDLAKIRRCATYLSDCELAGAFNSLIN